MASPRGMFSLRPNCRRALTRRNADACKCTSGTGTENENERDRVRERERGGSGRGGEGGEKICESGNVQFACSSNCAD